MLGHKRLRFTPIDIQADAVSLPNPIRLDYDEILLILAFLRPWRQTRIPQAAQASRLPKTHAPRNAPDSRIMEASSDILSAYFAILGDFTGYERRKAQETMVARVWQALESGDSLIVEAGTGSGKSFGYLIPALLHRRRPIVIATGTIALQEQLLDKDLPFLTQSQALKAYLDGAEPNVKLVKGRRNYVCIQKLQELERTLSPNAAESLHVSHLKSQLAMGWDGDRQSLDIAIPEALWQEVQSESDDCLGRRCRYYAENPYRRAREDLAEADVIIANHSLYLQDLASGQALLPAHDVVIFDEAHNFKRYAMNAFTDRVGKFASTKLLAKISRRILPIPESLSAAVAQNEATILHFLFRSAADSKRTVSRLSPDPGFRSAIAAQTATLEEIRLWLESMDLQQLSLLEPDAQNPGGAGKDMRAVQREKLLNQLAGLALRWECFALEDPFSRDRVNWVEIDRERLYFELRSTPLDIAERLAPILWEEKTSILTSATLSVNRSLAFCKRDLGLPPETRDLALPSPFDYARQCVLYLPKSMPDPNDPMFLPACADEIEAILRASQGRAFALFTGYDAMTRVADALIPRLPYPARVQGEMPRHRLIEWFKTTPHSVLFATATFWEGVDIPGESLSCVIMDKIPFSPPDDPVNQAAVDRMKARGLDWFGDYVLPQATIRLKQGFGRLIRSGGDRGLAAILDPRLRSKGYGRQILRSLPEVEIIDDLAQTSVFMAHSG
ncbi:MAG: hypothetical protein IPK79_06135 [Vampirovibrionales bacterium]|nr:hypothetical protein [Vampirovibrionales bacterium]